MPDFYGSQIGFHTWKQQKVSADVWERQKSVNDKFFLKMKIYLTRPRYIHLFVHLFV